MHQRLLELAAQINHQSTAYRNNLRVEIMREQKAQAGRSPGIQFERQLALELMRSGQSEAAIEQLESILAELQAQGIEFPEDTQRKMDRLMAISWLRLGEQENCILNHSIDSCLMPIRGSGVHQEPRGSAAAAQIYRRLLELDPEDLSARWLLNIACMTLDQYPDGVGEPWLVPEEVFASEYDLPRFRDVAMSAGLAEQGLCGGIVLDDLSGDGLLDVVVTTWDVELPMRYFVNDGQGQFVERTAEAGLSGQLGGLNLTHADYDNDGHIDLFVVRGAWMGDSGMFPNSLLRNRGDGTFEDVTERAGLLRMQPSPSAAFGDYNNDGWLDLFVANESRKKERPCELYRNNGNGTFTEVGASVGLNHIGFVKGAVWGDYNNDDRPDLFLSRMGQTNVLYRNAGPDADGVWSFEDVAAEAGVSEPLMSFPTWFFDYDNDGWLDLLVATFADFGGVALNMVASDYLGLETEAERTKLYRNRGDGTFEDVSAKVGIDKVLLAMGANFGDLDNDGWEDVYFGTGQPAFISLVPNVMLRNDNGTRFQDVTTSGGFGNIQKGHGIAFGDVDNDGDQDIFANMGGAYSGDVYQNVLYENPGFKHRWITLRLRGAQSNALGIGARVRLVVKDEAGNLRDIHRVVSTGGSFGSSSLQLEIGLGTAQSIERMEVRWPRTGKTDVFTEVPLNGIALVREGASELEALTSNPLKLGGKSTSATGHAHH